MLCAAFDIDGTLDVQKRAHTVASAIRRANAIGVHISIVSARALPLLWGLHSEVRKALDEAGVHKFFYNPWSPISTHKQVASKKVEQLLELKALYEKVVLFDDNMHNILAARKNGIPALRVSKDDPLSPEMINDVFLSST